MNPYSTHPKFNLYPYIFLLSLAIFVQNVLSSNINQLGDSLPQVTVGNGNICSDIFDNNQCMFIHKALDVLIHKYEKRLKDSEKRYEKKLKDSEQAYDKKLKDSELRVQESENKMRTIQVESMQHIKEISAIFQDRFDLKHIELDRKYKRLERRLLGNQNDQKTGQNLSSHNPSTNFSILSHHQESSAQKYLNNSWENKEYYGNKTLPNLSKVRIQLKLAQNTFSRQYLERYNVDRFARIQIYILQNYKNKRSHKIHKSVDNQTKKNEKWIDVDKWKTIGNLIHDFLISSTNDEKV